LGFGILGFVIYLGFGILGFGISAPKASAQYETQLMTLVGGSPIVLEAPFPFVEVSRSLPEAFAQRRDNPGIKAAGTHLVAWFIPRLDLKDQLNEKTGRYRSLQIMVEKDKERPRYTPEDFKTYRDAAIKGITAITENDIDTLFGIMDMSQFKQASARKLLGQAALGDDSFTLCIATSAEGKDLRGGRQIEQSVACVTNILLNGKVLVLMVTGSEISATELGNTMRLTREWITILRAANNAKPPAAVPSEARSSPIPNPQIPNPK